MFRFRVRVFTLVSFNPTGQHAALELIYFPPECIPTTYLYNWLKLEMYCKRPLVLYKVGESS